MRVKMSRLRRIIREALERGAITEAPFADVLPAFDAQSDRGPEAEKTHKSIERFHKTPVFLKKAAATFKGFPFDVYILPITADYDTEFMMDLGPRISLYDVSEGSELLEAAGLDREVISRAETAVMQGGSVIVSIVEGLQPNQLPTPWMIVHAAFDSDRTFLGDNSKSVMKKIYDSGVEPEVLVGAMTMRSATSGNIELDSVNDIVAELITQSIVDSRGVHFNLEGVSLEDQDRLAEIKSFIDGLKVKERFHNSVKGKFIFLKTAYGD